MRLHKIVNPLVALLLLSGSLLAAPGSALAQSGAYTRQISASGTVNFKAGSTGTDGLQSPEIRSSSNDAGQGPYAGSIVNRSYSKGNAQGVSVNSGAKAKSDPALNLSFNGLNHHDQRTANNGNQWSLEPPDQGLCAGNGYVMESLNDVLRVYNTSGQPVTGVVDLNTFYGYPPAIIRSTGVQGPFITDPSCLYDPDVQRWFNVVLTLDVDPSTGNFLGTNHLDIAVSQTSNPTGSWTIFRLPVQDDGTQGTPNHGCSYGPCLGDYPHIGADAYGFYITTNEYSFFGPEYKSAQVYAFSKRALAAGGTLTVTQFDTTGLAAGNPGFTIWPAVSPAGQYAGANGGTEYFLSSDAAAEANGTGSSTRIFQWSLTNTASLDSSTPALSLTNTAVAVQIYGIPPASDQKAGSFPLGQCLNTNSCAKILLGTPDRYTETESPLDSNDTRMQQTVYANGKLWGALDTAVTVGGVNKAGIEYFILNPSTASLSAQGYLALANNNLIYPAIGVTSSGRGVMAFTVVGQDYYPSAGYAGLDAVAGAGSVHIAASGLGPQDGFTGYKAYGNPPRPRWGDYGAAVTYGDSIWIASEYIGQTCTLAQYQAAPFGSCGGTRTALANWGTRISLVTP